jgi:hypothetical protein
LRIIQAGLDARTTHWKPGKLELIFSDGGALLRIQAGLHALDQAGSCRKLELVFSRLRDSLAARQGRLHWTTWGSRKSELRIFGWRDSLCEVQAGLDAREEPPQSLG